MRFAIMGAGAVGGYYGAMLVRAGQEVTFLARGPHLRALRERGLAVWGPLGDFVVRAQAEEEPAAVGPVDVVIFAVKTYDNDTAIPMLRPMTAAGAAVLPLQNGVDSIESIAAVVGEPAVLGGTTYIATSRVAPGVIEQTGTLRRIVVGEVFGDRSRVSDRVSEIAAVLASANIQAEAVADGWGPIWEKFIYLGPFAGFTGATRLPAGPLKATEQARRRFLDAVAEVEQVARAAGVTISESIHQRIADYMDALPPTTRSSLLLDLTKGKRLEVEALLGAAVRRGEAAGVATPIMATLYALLKPFEHGPPRV